MKKILKFILLFLPVLSSAQVSVGWNEPTVGLSIALDKLNNNYTINSDFNPAGDITLTKRNAAGNIVWETSYDNTDNTRSELATWVATDQNGNIIVTGISRSGFSNPVNAASIVMKFDSSGALLWRSVYENNFDGSSTKKCIVDLNGNIYVLGLGIGPNGMVTKVKKFSPAGVALWNYFDTNGIGAPVNIKFTPDNKILIIGRSITGILNGYSKITKGGNLVWNVGGVSSLITGDAAGDAFGNTYLVSGTYPVSGGTILKKINSAGITLWQQSFSTVGSYRVEVGSDNMPVMCGFPNPGSGGAAFLKTDANGNFLWQNLNADGANNFLLHAQLLLDQYNHAYLAAGILTGMGICKVNNDGSSAWNIVTAGGYSNAIAIGTDYAVYVVGGATARINQTIPCSNPSALFEDAITKTSSRVNWSFIPGMMQFEIWYKSQSATTWQRRFITGTSKRVNLTNLLCNTVYLWKVRSVCDSTGVNTVSAFSNIDTFTTVNCLPRIKVNNSENLYDITLFPNPANSYIYVTLNEVKKCELVIVDVNGKVVLAKMVESNSNSSLQLNIESLLQGLYVLQLRSEGILETKKFIKE